MDFTPGVPTSVKPLHAGMRTKVALDLLCQLDIIVSFYIKDPKQVSNCMLLQWQIENKNLASGEQKFIWHIWEVQKFLKTGSASLRSPGGTLKPGEAVHRCWGGVGIL